MTITTRPQHTPRYSTSAEVFAPLVASRAQAYYSFSRDDFVTEWTTRCSSQTQGRTLPFCYLMGQNEWSGSVKMHGWMCIEVGKWLVDVLWNMMELSVGGPAGPRTFFVALC
ncbi:hypothetical protein LOAG_01317 [Loa loa]|uniref:Uncharacterized protein n=1 Tax=Loa loa TaxID=7209 RepID=A0A1S0UBD1_LOALO|nr:hypothetical protein LOAG_01317 [Loa loa]EFO27172.1 hypothetical protein LOAG_01317 [Loa loa]